VQQSLLPVEIVNRTISARKWCVICTALPALHSMFASCASSGLRQRHTMLTSL